MQFSREPAAYIGLIGGILTAAASIGVPWLSAGQAAAIVAFLAAVAMAIRTRPVAPALFAAAFSALTAVFAEYGLHWTDAQVGGATGMILGLFAIFGIRPQVTPVGDRPID